MFRFRNFSNVVVVLHTCLKVSKDIKQQLKPKEITCFTMAERTTTCYQHSVATAVINILESFWTEDEND